MSKTYGEYHRAYYLANKDRILAYGRARHLAKPGQIAATAKAYYEANREEIAAKGRVYYAANRDKALLRRQIRDAYVNPLKAGPCSDCGQKFPPECMDFDHVRGTKLSNIAQIISRAALEVEIAKCDLVCANCHRTRTKTRRSR